MSRFKSTRQTLDAVDISQSSASLDPALSTLSPEDAQVLDAIISKVPEATTFMTVFKAYSDVLQQRGLDPGNDIVYYKQLLKLGVVKGIDWGTKWGIVKEQLGLVLGPTTPRRPAERILPSRLTGLPPHEPEEDVFTLHSHADETETAVDPPYRHTLRFRRPHEPGPSSVTDFMESLDRDSDQSIFMAHQAPSRPAHQPSASRNRLPSFPSETSEAVGEAPIHSSIPPLRRGLRERTLPSPVPRDPKEKVRVQPASHINDVEAWKNVQRERQLLDADRFRRESLMRLCFDTWKVGLDWVRTTHAQIADAREHIQVRIHFELWKERTARFRRVSERATQVAQFRTKSAAFNLWKEKTHRKQMAGWREEMRSRMAYVKRKREERMRHDAWTKWRQSYQSRQLYARNVFIRAFRHWREKSKRLVALESRADSFEDIRERRALENILEMWSRRVQMRDMEKYLARRVAQRKLKMAFDAWLRNAQDTHIADMHLSLRLIKKAFEAWRRAQINKHLLSLRGDKHLRRRDDVLLRAIVRVWVARERGQLLSRVKNARLMTDAFIVWHERHQERQKMQDQALSFSQQASNSLLISAFKTWARHYDVQQNVLSLAVKHYAANRLYRVLLIWRLRLRAKLKMSRQANMARKYFVEREAWDRWRFAVEEKRRRRKLQFLEGERIKRSVLRWLDVTRRRRHQARSTKAIQKRIRKRVLRDFLQHWTNRVVSLKLREIDTVEQHDRDILCSAFSKWKDMCLRHVENLSLVNSFLDVKREDSLRRMFFKWLSMARKSRKRHMRLAEREHEHRLETMSAAWETWQDRFRENRLRNIEYQVIIQNQTNILYSAFVIWQSRSKSVPGIRFYATNVKTKAWDKWRAALPQAMQARKAREMDAKNVLSAAFSRWSEAHRTKIALKAVARARYLRLPSPGQKASNSAPHTQEPLPLRPLLHRPLASRMPGLVDDNPAAPSMSRGSTPGGPVPFTRKRGLSSLLASRPVVTLDDSSPRPTSTGDDRRERLWNELRGVRLRESSSTSRAKSR